MKERNLYEMLPSTHISNYKSTCEKGIFKEFLMRAKRGIIYHMQAFDNNIILNINYNKIRGSE